jgi:hypothetical protein
MLPIGCNHKQQKEAADGKCVFAIPLSLSPSLFQDGRVVCCARLSAMYRSQGARDIIYASAALRPVLFSLAADDSSSLCALSVYIDSRRPAAVP